MTKLVEYTTPTSKWIEVPLSIILELELQEKLSAPTRCDYRSKTVYCSQDDGLLLEQTLLERGLSAEKEFVQYNVVPHIELLPSYDFAVVDYLLKNPS